MARAASLPPQQKALSWLDQQTAQDAEQSMGATTERIAHRVFDGQYMHRHLLFISVRDDVWYSAQLSVHHVVACRKSGDCIIGTF